jgi:hypothetical protein
LPAFEPGTDKRRSHLARQRVRGGLFCALVQERKERFVANHLTPEELSKELGIAREEVIRVCVQESIPIYQGKIDKSLFQAQLAASGSARNSA